MGLILLLIFLMPSFAFSSTPENLGTFHSKRGAYLKIGTYSSLDLKGPKEMAWSKAPSQTFDRFSKPFEICVDSKALQELFGNILNPSELEAHLPVIEDSAVVSGSVKKMDGNQICYQLQNVSSYIPKENLAQISEEAGRLFQGYQGVDALPSEVQQRLRKLWKQGKNLEEKVERLEHFWEEEIQYYFNDDPLYEKYFEQHPGHNLLQAALSLKKGDCLPKNYGLGVSIYQLSGGHVPVRMHFVVWLQPSENEPKLIDLGRLHLHVEYLAQDEKGRSFWKTAESSVDPFAARRHSN